MKKLFSISMFVLSIAVLSSCSSSGSKELVLNDVRVVSDNDHFSPNDISVVPGTYTLTWECDNYGTNDDFYVGKIKIKIKNAKQFIYNGDRKSVSIYVSGLDANGSEIPLLSFSPRDKKYEFSSGDNTDYDAINAVIDALTSPGGTISELTFSTGTIPGDAVEKFKKMENIKIECNDRGFKPAK